MRQHLLGLVCATVAVTIGVVLTVVWRAVTTPSLDVEPPVILGPTRCVIEPPPVPAQLEAPTAEETIKRMERYLALHEAERDSWTMSPLLAEDFTNTNPDGVLEAKDRRLGRISPSGRIRPSDLRDLKVRVLGDTAIATYQVTRQWYGSGGTLRVTDFWKKRQGQWLLVAAQETEIKERDGSMLRPGDAP
jgi:hypothetical protein